MIERKRNTDIYQAERAVRAGQSRLLLLTPPIQTLTTIAMGFRQDIALDQVI